MDAVISHMTMSLYGFVANLDDDPQEIFEWYSIGPVTVPSDNPGVELKVDADSARVLNGIVAETGALIAGRHLFDITNGWDDRHPIGAPVVVVTHEPPEDADRWPRTRFVGDVETAVAVAREIAGGKTVCISSPTIAQQAIALDLVDAIWVSVAPVLFGSGKRYFDDLGRHVRLEDPDVVPGRRALHLRYPVVKGTTQKEAAA
jgi:dihydrofolate reductase